MYFLDLFLVLYVKEEMGDWFYNACFKIQYTVEFFLQDRHIFVYSHLQILVTLTLILMSTIHQCLLMILRDISYTLLFPWHYKPHTYFLDITSHTLIFPGHYELHTYFLDIMSYTLLFPWHLDEGCHDWSPAYLGRFPGYSQLYGCPESVSESVPTCQELWGTTHAMPSAMVLPP